MKRVFIYSTHSIFAEGLIQLIEEQSDLEVVGCEDSQEQALNQIQWVHPDVILFVRSDDYCETRVDDRKILQAMGGKAQIIELNYENEWVSIISEEHIVISEFAELVRLIG